MGLLSLIGAYFAVSEYEDRKKKHDAYMDKVMNYIDKLEQCDNRPAPCDNRPEPDAWGGYSVLITVCGKGCIPVISDGTETVNELMLKAYKFPTRQKSIIMSNGNIVSSNYIPRRGENITIKL